MGIDVTSSEVTSPADLKLDPEHLEQVNRWLERGDGIAAYENSDIGHPDLGRRVFVSFGSEQAQIQAEPWDFPPSLPIDHPSWGFGWRYYLRAWYRGSRINASDLQAGIESGNLLSKGVEHE